MDMKMLFIAVPSYFNWEQTFPKRNNLQENKKSNSDTLAYLVNPLFFGIFLSILQQDCLLFLFICVLKMYGLIEIETPTNDGVLGEK